MARRKRRRPARRRAALVSPTPPNCSLEGKVPIYRQGGSAPERVRRLPPTRLQDSPPQGQREARPREGGQARGEGEKAGGRDSARATAGPPRVPPAAEDHGLGARLQVPGREDVSTHPWARWGVPGEGRRPPAPGLGWALSEAVGRAHGGARAKHRPERPAAGRRDARTAGAGPCQDP